MTSKIKEIVIRLIGQVIIGTSAGMLITAFDVGLGRKNPVILGTYLFLWVAGWAIYDSHYKFKNL